MAMCLILPVGVTGETVSELLKRTGSPSCIVSVTIPGYEEEKEKIRQAIELAAEMLGAKHYWVVVEPWNPRSIASVKKAIDSARPSRLLVVTLTGSRYLYLVLIYLALYYWRRGVWIDVVHGVEGGDYRVEPLAGYIAPALRMTPEQKKLLKLIYSTKETLSGVKLMREYGYTKVVYKLLSELEEKGLVRVKRNKIEKTFPGYLLYELMEGQ